MRRSPYTGGESLQTKLQEILQKVGKENIVKVGFLEGATYPDGTPVAMVAAIQNYGAPAAGIPMRAFFTNMVKEKSPNWGKSLGNLLKANDYDMRKTMEQMGAGIASQLQASIKETNAPALSEVTLMLRKMRSEDQSLVVTGKTVGEAAARVAAGESTSGVSTKPLNDTAHMQNSVDYEVGT